MAFLYPLLIVVHILICAALIIVVLLQSAKGEGLAGAFGGGGLSGAVFGGRGAATFLSKATSILAICFMLSSIGLTIASLGVKSSGGVNSGVIQNLKTGQTQQLPQAPSMPAATPQGTEPGAAQPGTAQPGGAQPGGAGSNLFNQPPSQGQPPAAQPQSPATATPPTGQSQPPSGQGTTK